MPPPLKVNISSSEEAAATGLVSLAALSLAAGSAAGLVGALFRLALVAADQQRDLFAAWCQARQLPGLMLLVACCAAATAFAAWLVRRYAPAASGSGIPNVEAVLDNREPQAPLSLVPVKLLGGWLAIGAGLALGREGPSVQVGAGVAHIVGRLGRRNAADCLTLLAAGAGAGLATAFNAPIGGAVFVIEELLRRFDTRSSIATLGASASAIAVSRLLLGQAPDFTIAESSYPGVGALPFYIILGLIMGVFGVGYNRTILMGLKAGAMLVKRLPIELLAGTIGATVGALAWLSPTLVGGGDALTQRTLTQVMPVQVLGGMLLVRFFLGPLSYSAHTPGGLFAPLLTVGTQIGMIYGIVVGGWFPQIESNPTAAGVVGMAAFFTAVVRAPLTGIVLVIEMTGSFKLLLPMLCACFGAIVMATMLREPPIYDSLAEGKTKFKATREQPS